MMFSESFAPVMSKSSSIAGGLALLMHILLPAFVLLSIAALASTIHAVRMKSGSEALFFGFWTVVNIASVVGVCL
ncbi:hypothetical protein [Propionivibrio sp.]|uniref:hypothetical protein n=1 Tax=Propionivibrio sp. TaxID=2212460 RepID=UPI003BF1ED22